MGRTKGAKNKVKAKVVKVEVQDDEIFIGEEQTQDTMMSVSTVNDQEEVVYLAQVSDQPPTDDEPTYEYFCSQCQKSFDTQEDYQVHSPCMVVYQVILPEDMTLQNVTEEKIFAKPNSKKNQSKLKTIGHLKSETDERGYLVYCNPNPKNPCYCCGEDESTAHNGQIKCGMCVFSFKREQHFEKHFNSLHAPHDKFPCTECVAKCSTEEVFKQHQDFHKTGKGFHCHKCAKSFTRKYHLERHFVHTKCAETPKDEIACDVCKKKFTRIDNLREHLRGHLGQTTRRRDFQCPYCEKAFYGSSLLNIHIRTHTKEKPFSCDLCDKAFPSSGALTKHRRSHTGERPYLCAVPDCGARFSAKETLNRHKKTHTGEKPHVCKVCQKSFIQNTQLRAHMFYHTGENGYKCDKCDAVFNRKLRLTEHLQYVHNGIQPPTCEYCCKTFVRKEDLTRHVELHVGERNFGCSICKKTFVTKAAVKIHLRTHRAEPPCVCSICQRKFIRIDCLVRHMRSKHRDQLQKIITDAEIEKIERVQQKQKNLGKDSDDDEIEIIYYEDDQKVELQNDVAPSDEDSESIELIPIMEEDEEELPVIKKDELEKLPIIIESKTIEPTSTISKKIKEPVKKKVASPKKERVLRARREPYKRKAEVMEADDSEDDDAAPIFLNDTDLKKRIGELLEILIEAKKLKALGFGKKPNEEVLCAAIKASGKTPIISEIAGDFTSKMRDNAKLLFSVALDEERITSLLNNHTVDEVITIVLKKAR